MIVFVVLAGILLLIGGSIYLSRDRIQENINDTLAPSRDQEMDETGTEEEEAENTEAAQNTGVTQNAEPRIEVVEDEATKGFSAQHNRYVYYEVTDGDPDTKQAVSIVRKQRLKSSAGICVIWHRIIRIYPGIRSGFLLEKNDIPLPFLPIWKAVI